MADIGGLFESGEEEEVSESFSRTTRIPAMTPRERQLIDAQVKLANRQLTAINKFTSFTNQQFNKFLPVLANEVNKFLPKEQQLTNQSLGFAGQQIGAKSELLRTAMGQIRQGTTLTPDQEKLISDSANYAIESGLSDISKYRDESLRSLAQETAIGRGLRPEDTPILDVGGRVINESSRQAQQSISGVRGQEAQQRLQYPIEAGNYLAGLTQSQQTQAASTQNFVQQLRQQAFNNRLNLTNLTGTLGNQAAGLGPQGTALQALTNARLAQTSTTGTGTASGETTSSPSIWDSIVGVAGGLGGASSGMGWVS